MKRKMLKTNVVPMARYSPAVRRYASVQATSDLVFLQLLMSAGYDAIRAFRTLEMVRQQKETRR